MQTKTAQVQVRVPETLLQRLRDDYRKELDRIAVLNGRRGKFQHRIKQQTFNRWLGRRLELSYQVEANEVARLKAKAERGLRQQIKEELKQELWREQFQEYIQKLENYHEQTIANHQKLQ